jgi:hypothetical protein
MPERDRGGRASGHGDGVTPRPAPYVIDDAAIAAAAAEIATLQSRIEAATGTVKERLSAARAEIASLQQRLADAEKASAALIHGKVAAEAEIAAQSQKAETWRKDFYASNRALIAELDRAALRVIAAAAPDPWADAAAPEVSIVMPVWNRADMIGTAVKSVLAQSFGGWELIIVDDGSTDDLSAALNPFLADPRIRLIRQANAGEGPARNRGLGLARGEVVAYLDSDNFWYPDFLDAAVRVFRGDPKLEIAYAGISYEWPNGDVRFYQLPYERAALLRDNLADINVIVHRRRAYERFGGFDEALKRAIEWDLMLRYTVEYPAALIPVVGARYRIVDHNRLSSRHPLADNVFRIRCKWWPRPALQPRVLYVANVAARLGESQIAAEVACMRRFGAQIEAWAAADGGSPLASDLVLHRGALADAIGAFKPDVLHLHGLSLAGENRGALAAAGVALTARAEGADASPSMLAAAPALPNLKHLYLPPEVTANGDARIRFVAPIFDTTLFIPAAHKDRRMILCAAASAPGSELRIALDLAKLVPAHRVVVAIARTDVQAEAMAALEAHRAETGSPAELLLDLPRAKIAGLMSEAGIYLHCSGPAGPPGQARWPASITEAMATGAYIVAPPLPAFARYIHESGAAYDSAETAAALIRATEAWSDEEWLAARNRSVERAFRHHADELVLRPMFEDWCALARENAARGLAASAD